MIQLQPDDYKVNLEVFEGPLDLLLYLIRKDEVDIYDIPIARIAAEYTEYIRLMKMLDLNMAGEFLVMASTLSYIKSRMLLPADTRGDETGEAGGEEEKDPRWELVRQLLDYKRFKEAANGLLELERRQQNMFGASGAPLVSADDQKEERKLSEIGIFDLIKAFHEVLERAVVEPIGEMAGKRQDRYHSRPNRPSKKHWIYGAFHEGIAPWRDYRNLSGPVGAVAFAAGDGGAGWCLYGDSDPAVFGT